MIQELAGGKKSHHPHSPSQLGRILLCPGSVRLSEIAPEERPSEEADMGTRCHLALSGGEPRLSDEERDLVTRCLGKIPEIAGDITDAVLLTEERCALIDTDGQVVTEGTADWVALWSNRAVVIDWKFGYQSASSVTAAFQLAMYGAAIQQKYGVPVQAFMYQPRADKVYEGDVPDVESAISWLKGVLDSGLDSRLTLNPSPEACTYCRALSICPAPRAYGLALAVSNELPALPPEELGRLARLAKVAEKQAGLVLDETKARLKDGIPVPGWKLQQRTTFALVEDKSGGAA